MVVSDFHVFIRDSLQHIDLMKKEHPELPVLILGHSMVSTIPYPSHSTRTRAIARGCSCGWQEVKNTAHSRKNKATSNLPFRFIHCQLALPHEIQLEYSQSLTFLPGSWS